MRNWFVFIFIILLFSFTPYDTTVPESGNYGAIIPKIQANCTFKGKKLWGKVKFVTAFADFKVQMAQYTPELKVKLVDYNPSNCGEWQVSQWFPDFKVQIVEGYGDFRIQLVDTVPGLQGYQVR